MLFLATSLFTSLSECMDTSPDNELQAPETITPKTSPSTRRIQISRSVDSSPKKELSTKQPSNSRNTSANFFIVEPNKEEQQNRRPSCNLEQIPCYKIQKNDDYSLAGKKHNPDDNKNEMASKRHAVDGSLSSFS
jgi:hypothetical protein